jgi:hypothetical protein
MKSEYIALHTAINLFEDFRTKIIGTILNITDRGNGWRVKIPKEIANFLFYIQWDNLTLSKIAFKEETIDGITLYGKDKKLPDKLIKIPVSHENCELGTLWMYEEKKHDSKELCIIRSNYDYKDVYGNDFNYAVLINVLSKEIRFTELSVKYDKYLELMKKLNNHIKKLLEVK